MIKVRFITNYFIFLFSKSKVFAYHNTKENCTLDSRNHTGSIYRGYNFVEYTIYSASYERVGIPSAVASTKDRGQHWQNQHGVAQPHHHR